MLNVKKQLLRKDLNNHFTICKYQLIECKYGCNTELLRCFEKKHICYNKAEELLLKLNIT